MKFMYHLLLAVLGLGFLSTAARATPITLTLEDVSAVNPSDTAYIYPYGFSVNGSTARQSLMCVAFDNETYLNETWTATVAPITGASSTIAQEDAFLFSQFGAGTYTNDDIQEAAWYLSAANPSQVHTTWADSALLALAATTVSSSGYKAFDQGQFSLYTPVTGTQNSGYTVPQTFVGSSPVPEPSSLILLTSGLLSSAGILYRKTRRA